MGKGTMKLFAIAAICCAATMMGSRPADAVLVYNTNVTPDVIMGTGNANGGFTVDQANGVELGLRGKLRFDGTNQPQNVFNYTGISGAGHGVYTFAAVGVNPLNGPVPSWANSTTPIWNFEWSVNADYLGTANRQLNDLTYGIFIDFNPAAADVPNLTFDPINVTFADHSIGTNATGNGAGLEAANAAGYAALINANNVAQQSWNMEFFDIPASAFPFNPTTLGTYTIRLDAYSGINLLASTSIDVVTTAVPEASAFVFGSLVLAGVGAVVAYRKRQSKASA
jgi:hypothetical protein